MLRPRQIDGARPAANEASGLTVVGDEEAYDENKRKVYCLTKGRVFLRGKPSTPVPFGEPLTILMNYPTRGKVWPFEIVCVNHHTGDIAVGDERGQIYTVGVAESTYRVSRLASSGISAMEFVHGRIGSLVVAFENGRTLVIDTRSKEIIGNIQCEETSPQRMIRCHPKDLLAATVSDNLVLGIWDLQLYRRVLSFDATEAIVDMQFEKKGEFLAVVFAFSGLSLFRSTDGLVLGKASLPEGERRPKWTAYTSSSITLKAFVAGSNGLVYMWDLSTVKAKVDCAGDAEPLSLPFLGTLELPVKITTAVKLVPCGDSHYIFRAIVVGDDGAVIIIEIEGRRGTPCSTFHVVSDIKDSVVFGAPLAALMQPSAIDGTPHKRDYYRSLSSPMALRSNASSASVSAAAVTQTLPMCVADRNATLVTFLGVDGAVRIFDPENLYGLDSSRPIKRSGTSSLKHTGSSVLGNELRSRIPQSRSKSRAENDVGDSDLDMTKPLGSSRAGSGSKASTETDKGVGSQRESTKFSGATEEKKTDSNSSKDSKKKNSLKSDRDNKMPLFELASATPAENRVTLIKLRSFLKKNGEFPVRYRTLIWRFLLKLPENTDAYVDLVRRGNHDRFVDLEKKYPIRSRRVFERLHRACCQMAHWAAVFGETSYLPQVIFPFLLVYGSDELAVFETVMTVFMWWGFSWHATFPHSPAHVLDTFDNLLLHNDAKLHSHFKSTNTSVGVVCWNMLSSLFTEVLSKSDWLVLMDFLFAYIDNQAYLYLAPVALLRAMRITIFGITDSAYMIKYFRSQQGFIIKDVLQLIFSMHTHTPQKLFSIVASTKDGKKRSDLNIDSDEEDEDGDLTTRPNRAGFDESAQARESIALSRGKPRFPLPKGRYPAFSGVPDYLVDWQLKDRERAMALSSEKSHRESILVELENKIKKLESSHAEWMLKHQSATAAEVNHRSAVMEEEKKHLDELLTIEEAISKAKVASLSVVESVAREELELLSKLAKDSEQLISINDDHMKEKMNILLAMQRHREIAETAEFSTQERLSRMFLGRTKDEWMSTLAMTLENTEKEIDAKNTLIAEKWKQEDEQLRQKRIIRTQQIKSDLESETFTKLQSEIVQKMQRLQLARDAKVMEVERSRAVRIAREQADEAAEVAERAQILLQKAELASNAEATAKIAEEGLSVAQKHLLETVEMTRAEGARLIAAERKRIEKQRASKVETRNAELRREWAKQKEKHLRAVLEAEQAVQEQVLRMQRAVVEAEVGDDSSVTSGRSMREVQARIERLGDEILQEQRDRFKELRDEAFGLGIEVEKQATAARRKSLSKQSSRASRAKGIVDESDEDSSSSDEPGMLPKKLSEQRARLKNMREDALGLDVDASDGGVDSEDDSSLGFHATRIKATKGKRVDVSMLPLVDQDDSLASISSAPSDNTSVLMRKAAQSSTSQSRSHTAADDMLTQSSFSLRSAAKDENSDESFDSDAIVDASSSSGARAATRDGIDARSKHRVVVTDSDKSRVFDSSSTSSGAEPALNTKNKSTTVKTSSGHASQNTESQERRSRVQREKDGDNGGGGGGGGGGRGGAVGSNISLGGSSNSRSSQSRRDELEELADASLRALNATREQVRREAVQEDSFMSSLTQRVRASVGDTGGRDNDSSRSATASASVSFAASVNRSGRSRHSHGLYDTENDFDSVGGDSALWAASSASGRSDPEYSEDDDSLYNR